MKEGLVFGMPDEKRGRTFKPSFRLNRLKWKRTSPGWRSAGDLERKIMPAKALAGIA